ncbi:putative reverse transcriptase domain-containing protein [Tanacetum coccineum]
MRQRRWIELFSDYDCEIRYHPGKANVVADALSGKERVKPKRVQAMNMTLQSSIKDRILAAQKEACDESARLQKGLDEMIEHMIDGALYYLDRIWVPMKDRYWWPGMKKDITVYDGIAMDFVKKLPMTSSGHDTIWVIMDRLTKSAYFLPIREDYKMDRLARLYLNEIVARHGIKDRLKAARDCQKSYADKRRKPLEFSIVEKLGYVAYRLRLPEELNGVYDTFHVSNLKKCLADPTLQVPLDEIQVDAKLNFLEEPVEILEREFKKLKWSRIAIVKIAAKINKIIRELGLEQVEGILVRDSDELQALQDERKKINPQTAEAIDKYAPSLDTSLTIDIYERTPEQTTSLGYLVDQSQIREDGNNESSNNQASEPMDRLEQLLEGELLLKATLQNLRNHCFAILHQKRSVRESSKISAHHQFTHSGVTMDLTNATMITTMIVIVLSNTIDGSTFLLYKNAFEESFLDSLYKSTASMDLMERALYLENDREMEVAYSDAVASCCLLNAASITAALIDLNVAQSKLVLLENFIENYSKCLRLLYKVNVAEGVNVASEEVSTAELVSTALKIVYSWMV